MQSPDVPNWCVYFIILLQCPFHGLIIPRNELGEPTKAEDIARLTKLREQQEKGKYTLKEYHD